MAQTRLFGRKLLHDFATAGADFIGFPAIVRLNKKLDPIFAFD
jgi:hypothetical protein